MPKSRFTEEKIVKILQGSEAGAKTEEICRRYGIARQTFYSWRKKYGGMELSDVKRLCARPVMTTGVSFRRGCELVKLPRSTYH